MQDCWLFIRNGIPDPRGLVPLAEYHNKITPRLEVPFSTQSFSFTTKNLTHTQIVDNLVTFYLDQIKQHNFYTGPYGDWIKCSLFSLASETFLHVDFIAQTQWIRASQAADLGIFVKNTHHIFFVGIVRRNEPGKGQPAILGGILDVGKYFDSPAYTAIKEAEEECSLRLQYHGNLDELREDYMIKSIPVNVLGFDVVYPKLEKIATHLQFCQMVKTPEQERNPDGTKRVYVVTSYTILIDVQDHELSQEKLAQIFKSGDDACGISIHDITPNFRHDSENSWIIPNFGLHHHPILFKHMIYSLKQNYNLKF